MKKTVIFCLAIGLVLGMFTHTFATNTEKESVKMQFQEVKITLAGTAETKADYFNGKSPRAVVFAPGAMFSKESWHFLAARFQELGIASVALNSGSTPDLLNAIAFLKTKGAAKIAIVGASAGGAGVLFTLQDIIDESVDTMVLLAPAGGTPLQNEKIRKLFIVAEDDMISSSAEVYNLYIASSDPKVYKELKGSDHAQRLFDSKQKEDVIQLIIHFVQS